MVGHQPIRYNGQHCPGWKQLRIAWANVGKASECHDTILCRASDENIDVICIQEPWTLPGTVTKNHPGYYMHAPVIAWDSREERENERPRVLTYTRKGVNLRAKVLPRVTRDILWTEVNGYAILNVYQNREAPEPAVTYIQELTPPSRCVIGGDMNARHESFEPGSVTTGGGSELARWAQTHAMDFIGQPGVPTHRAGHVIDLTFSNIPFADTVVRPDMHSGSDHATQVTTLPTRGLAAEDPKKHKVLERHLERFTKLVGLNITGIRDPARASNQSQLQTIIQDLTQAIEEAIQTAGVREREQIQVAPWWTTECQTAYRRHLRDHTGIGSPPTEATREFLKTVRRTKKAYWRDRIDGIKTDSDLYSLARWHKLLPNQQDSPLVVNGETITDTAEKAEALRRELLDRFNNADDLPAPPGAENYTQNPLPWDTKVSTEEAERYAIGVASTSPGADGITVRLLKACWADIRNLVRAIYQRCLELEFYPGCWRVAEVTMIPKAGKKDRTSARSIRPIALLSCIGKGLERLVARRIATTAMTHDIISPQHVGAVPKRSAMDIVAAFTHDVEQALAVGKRVTMVTMDVQGAFDALLKNRLLHRMAQQGWPPACVRFIDSFLSERYVQVRLGKEITPRHLVACGTPQGSPLSPILYTLYLAELLNQDRTLRFGYADDINIYRASKTLDENVQLLAEDIQAINQWGAQNKVTFAPEKLEAIHITRQQDSYSPSIPLSDATTLEPIAPAADRSQTALRWLGVWFDRQLSFKHHVAYRAAATRKLASHLRGLANTAHGPPPDAMRKLVTTCVLPSLLYGTEAWYEGRTRNPRSRRKDNPVSVSTRVGQHITAIQTILIQAVRAVLPVYKTTPLPILFREAGIPSAEVALEEARWRFALRLQTIDHQHPLTHRAIVPHNQSGTRVGERQQPRTKIQRLGLLLPAIPRPALIAPHFSQGCRTDPTLGIEKKTAAKEFKEWWASLDSSTITIFSDGSEQRCEGKKRVTYGYAIYRAQEKIATGRGSLHSLSHVFDAEAIGACRALQHAAQIARPTDAVHMCIDSTSVIWCLRGTASNSSQWAFLQCQEIMDTMPNVEVRWAPGHTDIEGNEAADNLADAEAKEPSTPFGLAAQPTVSGIRTIRKAQLAIARAAWWNSAKSKLSNWYTQWKLPYQPTRPPQELELTRPTLARLLAIRTSHGDFAWYHRKFHHDNATLECSCGRPKTPLHIALCRKTTTANVFRRWPRRPPAPPRTPSEAIKYLKKLWEEPEDFAALLEVTGFYSTICRPH